MSPTRDQAKENGVKIWADTHVHVYPCYHPARLFSHGAIRLRAAAGPDGKGVLALFLTEGEGFDFYTRLRDGSHGLPAAFRVEPAAESEAVRVAWDDDSIWVFAGRQIVTAERLEILALTLLDGVPDGVPTGRTVELVRETGAVPVLAWAPGKWWFRRGDVVKDLIEGHEPGQLLVGDTALRPTVWPEPRLMQRARRRGLGVIAGSDPLPFAGDETQAGGYGVRGELDFDENRPVSSVRAWLQDPRARMERIGRRNGPVEMPVRMRKHQKSK